LALFSRAKRDFFNLKIGNAWLYWLLGTSVRKIAIFVFSFSLFAWRVKPERGKNKDVVLARKNGDMKVG
jgi:hypothetical protein